MTANRSHFLCNGYIRNGIIFGKLSEDKKIIGFPNMQRLKHIGSSAIVFYFRYMPNYKTHQNLLGFFDLFKKYNVDFREQLAGLLQILLMQSGHILETPCLKNFRSSLLIKTVTVNSFEKTDIGSILKNLCSLQSINLVQPNMNNDIKQNSLIRELYGYL